MSERVNNRNLYYTESFWGGLKKFSEIQKGVQNVLTQTMEEDFIRLHGEEKGEKVLQRSHGQVRKSLSSLSTDAALLRVHGSDEIVGFGYAVPAPQHDIFFGFNKAYQEELHNKNIELQEFIDLQKKTAEVGWVAIMEEHRGQGGWSQMMESLEGRLRSRGYEHMTRFVRRDNSYDSKVKSRYGEKVIYEQPFEDPEYLGKQMYFRVKLK